MGKVAVEGDFAQADDNPDADQRLNFIGKVSSAVSNLLRRRLIARRRAANHGGYPGVAEFEAVFAGETGGLAGQTQFMKDGIHKGSRAIAGEGPSRPVGAMSAG